MMLAAIVDSEALAKVIIYSLVLGIGVTVVFSFGIVGMTRFEEIRQGYRTGHAFPWAVLALVSAVLVVGVVVEAIVVMTNK
jgi:energy-converting hydrogenase Eha subunit A